MPKLPVDAPKQFVPKQVFQEMISLRLMKKRDGSLPEFVSDPNFCTYLSSSKILFLSCDTLPNCSTCSITESFSCILLRMNMALQSK